jgi:dihydropteroate synthase
MTTPFDFTELTGPAFMGIVNITPDSFSDGGKYFIPGEAVEHARALAKQGAQVIDLGAEASSFFRPGVTPISNEEQLRRLRPVLAGVTSVAHAFISIDTRSSEVARETLAQGAHIINDISAGTHDPAMFDAIVGGPRGGGAVILMHMGANYPENPVNDDPDIFETVRGYLEKRVDAALEAGIPRDKIAVDPGLGFGKTPYDNWTLAFRAQELQSLGVPVVLGASRKRFLETLPPPQFAPNWRTVLAHYSSGNFVHHLDAATAALTHIAIENGVAMHRVHNVNLSQFVAI